MTNETKPSTRRTAIEVGLVLLAVAFVLAFPVTRATLGVSLQTGVEMIARLPGLVWDGVSNAWNWIF